MIRYDIVDNEYFISGVVDMWHVYDHVSNHVSKVRDFMRGRHLLGELGRGPKADFNVDLGSVSHIIQYVEHKEGSHYEVQGKVLKTPRGQVLEALLEENIFLTFNTRVSMFGDSISAIDINLK